MKPTPEATYERAKRLANVLAWTVSLQCRRIQSNVPEDDKFILRLWADYEFLINVLSRLRKVAVLASNVPLIKVNIEQAIVEFDKILPNLGMMRNTLEHMDEYALDLGRNKNVSRKDLEVGMFSDKQLEWLGSTLKTKDATEATNILFEAISKGLKTLQALNKTLDSDASKVHS